MEVSRTKMAQYRAAGGQLDSFTVSFDCIFSALSHGSVQNKNGSILSRRGSTRLVQGEMGRCGMDRQADVRFSSDWRQMFVRCSSDGRSSFYHIFNMVYGLKYQRKLVLISGIFVHGNIKKIRYSISDFLDIERLSSLSMHREIWYFNSSFLVWYQISPENLIFWTAHRKQIYNLISRHLGIWSFKLQQEPRLSPTCTGHNV